MKWLIDERGKKTVSALHSIFWQGEPVLPQARSVLLTVKCFNRPVPMLQIFETDSPLQVNMIPVSASVCFISFVSFDDDVIQKVIEIIEFWKKFPKANGDAFYDVWLQGLFYKNLYLMTNDKMLFKIIKKHHYLGFWWNRFSLSCSYF